MTESMAIAAGEEGIGNRFEWAAVRAVTPPREQVRLALWAIGVLSHPGLIAVTPWLCGRGLWLPGAGFIAVGAWLSLLFPVVLACFGCQ